MIVLAIVGTRDGMNKELFTSYVNYYIRKWGTPDLIISGGCKGIDNMAEKYAKDNDIPFHAYKPKTFFDSAPDFLGRNTEIAETCTHCLAFPSKTSKGTWDTIRKATKLHRKIKIVQV